MAVSESRARAVDAFLDAAERLLIEVGYAGITTRRLAREAGLWVERQLVGNRFPRNRLPGRATGLSLAAWSRAA